MENNKTTTTEMIQLVQGTFTPSQATDIVLSLLNQKINYHKLEEVQLWEQNHTINLEPLKNRIAQLEIEKQKATEFINQMKLKGSNLEINGVLAMKEVKQNL